MWNRELKAASEIVKQRRKQRKLERKRRRDRERQRQRQRQRRKGRELRYNDYLPEDAPGSLLALIDYDEDETNNDDDDYHPGSLPTASTSSSSSSSSSSCLSPLQKWFVSLIASIGVDAWDEIDAYNITSLAYLYKHHVSFDDSDEYFGTYGDRTEEMKANHESLIAFWSGRPRSGTTNNDNNNINKKNNVVLLGMHGVDLAESDKLVPTLQQMYHLDPREAYARAEHIQQLIQSLPGAFNNPILTANAIAIQSVVHLADGENSSGGSGSGSSSSRQEERDSIIVGDGVFDFLTWLELKKDGPDYIHSHEFGHHLQYDLGVDTNYAVVGNGNNNNNNDNDNNNNDNNKMPTPGEQTRRWEMMADAFGSYYLAHAAGARMNSDRLLEVHRAAFSLGDCEDAVGSHHGTPRQRECASNYGANLASTSYWDDGERYVIPPSVLRRMFDGDYGGMLELGDGLCEAVVDASVLDETVYGEVSVVGSYAAAAAGGGGGGGGNGGADGVPNDLTSPANNDLDRPPPVIQSNGTQHDEDDEGWYGETRSQWRMPRSAGVSLDARLALIAAVTMKIIMNI